MKSKNPLQLSTFLIHIKYLTLCLLSAELKFPSWTFLLRNCFPLSHATSIASVLHPFTSESKLTLDTIQPRRPKVVAWFCSLVVMTSSQPCCGAPHAASQSSLSERGDDCYDCTEGRQRSFGDVHLERQHLGPQW